MRKLLASLVASFILTPVAQAGLSPAQWQAHNAILQVWGHNARGRIGLRIAWCESTWRTWAANGSHLGLFQMGGPERRIYGHGSGAMTQARAALRYYFVSGLSPWNASRRCWG